MASTPQSKSAQKSLNHQQHRTASQSILLRSFNFGSEIQVIRHSESNR